MCAYPRRFFRAGSGNIMKNSVLLAILLISLGISAFGQDTSRRPRVAATPEPQVMSGQTPRGDDGGPPVLSRRNDRSEPGNAQADNTPDEDNVDDVIRIETNLVTMPVSVLDRNGRFVTGLTERDFRIFENGVEQNVDYFQSVEQPFTVILMIDVSPSTQYRIDEIHDAAISFIDQLRPNDKVMVIAFDENVRVLARATNDRRVLYNAIRQAQFGDGTSLYEAVDHAINRQLRLIAGRKAVVLFTDGVDTTSRRANYESTIADAEEVDAIFYPIRYDTMREMNRGGISTYPRSRGGTLGDLIGIVLGGGNIPVITNRGPAGSSRSEYETGEEYLRLLAQKSGGRKFEATTVSNLDSAFAGIAEELRRQYSLGYYPATIGTPGERRQIQIRVMRPNLVVRAKTSYIVGEGTSGFAGN